ncbi:WecB/TagA/CpsF family glycosyltransferase [Oceanicella actignis]|uniref:Polymer biosynthesis protein, WecB/TagA/CpsF family n=1 Tax=Oceanicella actignis TaxID=1189325 RepID=A0A1M7TN71_9RHOB|nr:WecB/TagA/CpsF family glycosyltransferase [Oceanicella actignis]SET72064.1 hypothetical protein SAMN04488119_10835 [Oceanicella actignis]SHN72126.1 hypothetical protein SAMN05216200_10836 [Oceanicella actignis]
MTDVSAAPLGAAAPSPLDPGDAVAAALCARVHAVPCAEDHALPPRRPGPRVIAFLNAHAVNLSAASPDAAAAFLGADLLLRDGIGVKIMMRLLGFDPGANANGTDLIPRIAAARGRRVALYGALPGVAEEAASALRALGARVVATRHGYHPSADYEKWMLEDAPDLLILGMGAPRQEILADTLRARARVAGLDVDIVCGGAILDFLSGRSRRAPRWMRAAGLEWAHRLIMEPRRLARRYLLGNPVFLMRALRLAAARRIELGESADGARR